MEKVGSDLLIQQLMEMLKDKSATEDTLADISGRITSKEEIREIVCEAVEVAVKKAVEEAMKGAYAYINTNLNKGQRQNWPKRNDRGNRMSGNEVKREAFNPPRIKGNIQAATVSETVIEPSKEGQEKEKGD